MAYLTPCKNLNVSHRGLIVYNNTRTIVSRRLILLSEAISYTHGEKEICPVDETVLITVIMWKFI